jgi:hypothetical protein
MLEGFSGRSSGKGLAIDFRRIEKVGFGLQCLGAYIVKFSIFEEQSIICEADKVPNQIYYRVEDELSVSMKSMSHSENASNSQMQNELENLINLRRLVLLFRLNQLFGRN